MTEINAVEAKRERWREYSKSEAGRLRYRRWRQSAYGKARLRENYRRRKEWLDGIKAITGCLSCGESNARVLRFWPRDPQKIEFLPALENVSIGKREWLKVIRTCDVFCLNCLGKKKASRKRGRSRIGPKFRVRMPQVRQSVEKKTRSRGDGLSPEKAKIKVPKKSVNGKSKIQCSTCESMSVPKKRNKKGRAFYSPRCRLLFWAARKILEAYRLGQAGGLQGIIAELTEMR